MVPEKRVIRVAIIGGGISGIAQAVRLKESLGSGCIITIYEKGLSPGGVWRDSNWPGAGVDIPIVLYQLYSELNPNWSTKFAERDEVLAYWNSIIDKHNLRSSFKFSHEFTSSVWSISTQSHTLTFLVPSSSADSDSISYPADIVISAAGALNTPIIPTLPGISTFTGDQWHSSRWPETTDVRSDLREKKVAVVGNGSSGIQVVPNIVGVEGISIHQFIRSPGYFTPKVNTPYSNLTRFAFAYLPFFERLYRWRLFYQFDSSSLAKGMGKWSSALREVHTDKLVNYLKGKAPEKYWEVLIPKYPLHCKRVAYNANWLESLHLPNVQLTSTPIVSVTPEGLLTSDGVVHEFDVIVWATGFDVGRTGVGLNKGVVGEGEKDLAKVWEEKEGAEAYLSVAVPEFPNYFIILGPNAISMSWGYTLGNQTEFISRLITGLRDYNLTSISPTVEAAKEYNVNLQDRLSKTVLVSTACNAWYRYKGVGKVIAPSGFSATELYLRTRQIKWEDWKAQRISSEGKVERVEVKSPFVWNPVSLLYGYAGRVLERYLYRITT